MILMAASSNTLIFPQTFAMKLDDSISDYLAFAFQEDSEFTQMFNAFLLKLRQSGVMNKIHQKWIPSGGENGNGNTNLAVVLGFENLSFPFLGLAFGAVVAVALELGLSLKSCCSCRVRGKVPGSLKA